MSQFFLGTLVPMLGLLLAALLALYGVYYRWIDSPEKIVLSRRAVIALAVLAVLFNGGAGLRYFFMQNAKQDWRDGAVHRAARAKFVLPMDFQYGEITIPAGSLINRNDPFDKGEPNRPLALHGLEAVRFSQPVLIAGVWATAMQVMPMRLELAQDQQVGPVYRFDNASQAWVVNSIAPKLGCKTGQHAIFQVPHISYDTLAEMDKPPPDGPEARFLPSQWMFRSCEKSVPIDVQPVAS